LLTCASFYFLYIKNESQNKSLISLKNNHQEKSDKFSFSSAKNYNAKQEKVNLNKNIRELKQMLLKSKNMISEYNTDHETSIISNNDLNKLISLDLEQKNNYSKEKTSDEIVLEEDINSEAKEEVKLNEEVSNEQKTQKVSKASSNFSTLKTSTPIEKKQVIESKVLNEINENNSSAADSTVQKDVVEEKKLLKNQISEIENIIQSLNIN